MSEKMKDKKCGATVYRHSGRNQYWERTWRKSVCRHKAKVRVSLKYYCGIHNPLKGGVVGDMVEVVKILNGGESCHSVLVRDTVESILSKMEGNDVT